MPDITISDEINRSLPGNVLCAAEVLLDPSGVDASGIENAIKETVGRLKATLTVDSLKDHPVARALRDFYWRIGIDPTKQRPASEALVRRILRGQSFPRVNAVVDAYNLASARTMIPIGAYDAEQLAPPLELRFSKDGEVFHDLTGQQIQVWMGQIVLSDTRRIVHLYPHRDSYPTRITENTRSTLAVACGVPGVDESHVVHALQITCDNLIAFAGGRLISTPATIR